MVSCNMNCSRGAYDVLTSYGAKDSRRVWFLDFEYQIERSQGQKKVFSDGMLSYLQPSRCWVYTRQAPCPVKLAQKKNIYI